MNRRKFLAALGIVPLAPKVLTGVVTEAPVVNLMPPTAAIRATAKSSDVAEALKHVYGGDRLRELLDEESVTWRLLSDANLPRPFILPVKK